MNFMKILILLLSLILSTTVFSQVNLRQDSTDIVWKKIETNLYEVVYPDHVEKQAQYITGLLKLYSPLVAKRYRINQKKISIVLRPNSADPNGFVTLAPRRSEWFMHTSFTPFIGSLEWYQSLAIHEYRHVVQFDFLNRSNLKAGYIIGGESILGLLMNIAMPSWYFEGDAVWTETVLSNAGRGRSPRFMARLKALVSSEYEPTLDQLLGGDFTNVLPNHYVYGYVFITKAMLKYGGDIWYHIAARASDEPLNPYAIYDAFYEMTGLSFDSFYQQTISELKTAWGPSNQIRPVKDWLTHAWPMSDGDNLYILKRDLDHYWELFNTNDMTKPLGEFNIFPTLSKTDMRNGKFLYSQLNPHYRYGFMSTSDLFLYDIQTKDTKQITKDRRFYHPQFNKVGSRIVAVEYTKKNQWQAVVMDLAGKIEHTIPSTPRFKIVEAVFKTDSKLLAITLDELGYKEISEIDLLTKEITPLSPQTRNNIFALSYDDQLYFEADDMGAVNIFSYDFTKEEYSKCTEEYIAGYSARFHKKELHYLQEVSHGRLPAITSECTPIVKADIFKNYLASTPSDYLHQREPIDDEKARVSLKTKETTKPYAETSGSLMPHSWSFISGRGTELSATTDNILGSLNLSASAGTNPEEAAGFGNISVSWAKYYPIFSLQVSSQDRKAEVGNEDITWNESSLRFTTTLPYIYQNNLYQGSHFLSLIAEQVTVNEKDQVIDTFELNDQTITGTGFRFESSYLKQTFPKQIFNPWGYNFNFFYEDFRTSGSGESVSYLGSYNLDLYAPGIGEHHGIKLSTRGEYRPENEDLYRQQREYIPIIGYTFSRGYAYDFTPRFQAVSLDYAFTLGYPNAGYKDWIYFTRIYAQLFGDYTLAEYNRGDRTLNSHGIEFYFDTNTFRKFPLTYGLRFLNRSVDNQEQIEFFINLF